MLVGNISYTVIWRFTRFTLFTGLFLWLFYTNIDHFDQVIVLPGNNVATERNESMICNRRNRIKYNSFPFPLFHWSSFFFTILHIQIHRVYSGNHNNQNLFRQNMRLIKSCRTGHFKNRKNRFPKCYISNDISHLNNIFMVYLCSYLGNIPWRS